MSYIRAVLKTLSDLGISETELSAADFTTISEWEKQEIPEMLLTHILTEHLAVQEQSQPTNGVISRLESRVLDEYVAYLERHVRLDYQLSANRV